MRTIRLYLTLWTIYISLAACKTFTIFMQTFSLSNFQSNNIRLSSHLISTFLVAKKGFRFILQL